MKKRLFILLVVLAIAVSVLAVTANADTEVCPYCGQASTWTALTVNTQKMTDGHYYLTGDLVSTSHTVAEGATVCLNLKGYQYTANKTITVESGGTMNMWNGTIKARGTANANGGVWDVQSGGALIAEDVNITKDTYDRQIARGGFLHLEGTATLKNATLNNGVSTDLGGNIFVSSTGDLTLSNATVTGGTASTGGPCTYIRGKVTLMGATNVDSLYIVPKDDGPALGEMLHIKSDFTGSALVQYYTTLEENTDMGSVEDGADLSGLTVKDSQLQLKNTDGNLIAYLPIPVAIRQDGATVSEHETMTEALEKLSDGQTLMLQRDLDEEVTVSADVTLDLNGNDLTAVNVTAGTLYVMDSQTDDYTVSDGVYGKIGSISGDVQGLVIDEYERYLAYTEDSGTSFHKLYMQLYEITLRSTKVALYFNSIFKGDEKVQAQIDYFGVSMGLDQTELDKGTLTPGTYTAISPSKFNGSGDTTSSLLTNIMQTTQGSITNRRNAATTVYGKPYIKLTNDTILWGTTAGKSLQETVQSIDDYIAAYKKEGKEFLTETQEHDLLDMYYKFKNAMSKWTIPEVKAAYEAHEEETLKILTIGNSHANDSNWQLRNVFQQQNPDKKVVVGVLYYSGCSVAQHVGFAQNNSAEYQYYKNETGSWIGHGTPLDTMKDALIDEQWDIILLQEMNIALGQTSTFDNTDLQTLINYVKKHADGTPILGFNMVWANPVTDIYWDEDTRPTDLPNKWVERYATIYGTDQQHMYECMTANTQAYIATNENINNDYIMPSGTAVQYANNVLGYTDLDLYRDYTHISEFSRLMVSYLWYAKLTGDTFDSIDDIKVDVIPQSLRHSRFQSEGDMEITDAMKQTIVTAINYAMANPYTVPETMQTADPATDDSFNVLMIGNSFCYYFPDELVEMAKAAGKQLRICNVYYSGCRLSQHYTWLKNGNSNYDFFIRSTDSDSYIEINNVSLEYCLSQYNWDIITLQPGSGDVRNAESAEAALKSNKVYLDYLLGYCRDMYPMTQYAWHHTWAYQVGQTSHATPIVTTLEDQHAYDELVGAFARLVCETYELDRINTGEAWRIVRDGGYDKLCARLGKKWADDAPENSGDGYHDGDIGGGQYLNACVWYEYLFDLDVRENTFVPTYDGAGLGGLNKNGDGAYAVGIDYKLLQKAAHTAFTNGTYETPEATE